MKSSELPPIDTKALEAGLGQFDAAMREVGAAFQNSLLKVKPFTAPK